MHLMILGRSNGLKKKTKKKITSLEQEALVRIWINKMHNYILVKNVPVFVPVFLYAVTMLIFQIKRIISSEKWFN